MAQEEGIVSEIVFHCTQCGAALSAEEDDAGAEFDCPECGGTAVVPDESASAAQTVADDRSSYEEDMEDFEDEEAEAEAKPSGRSFQVKVPKKKIVLPTEPAATTAAVDTIRSRDYDDEDIINDVGGNGLRMFAVASGTVGTVLCIVAIIWASISINSDSQLDAWLVNMIFGSTFLIGIMGIAMAKLCFVLVRVATRLGYEIHHRR